MASMTLTHPVVSLAIASLAAAMLTGSTAATPAPTAASAATHVSQPAPVRPVVNRVAVVPADSRWEFARLKLTVVMDPPPQPPAPRSSARQPLAAPALTTEQVAQAMLDSLPGSGGVRLSFDQGFLDGHLGMADLLDPSTIWINTIRLRGKQSLTGDTVRHELAHVYQARLVAVHGLDAVQARLGSLFGSNGTEKAADCVAIRLGATYTGYGANCAGTAHRDAVDALIAGRMP